MKYLFVFVLCFTSSLVFCQGLDTIQVSNGASTYILMPTEIVRIEVGNPKAFIGTHKDNYVVLKAIQENGPSTSLMVQSKGSIDFMILKYVKTPTKLVNDYRTQTSLKPTQNKSVGNSNEVVIAANNSKPIVQQNVEVLPVKKEQQNQNKRNEPEEQSRSYQGTGHISPEVYAKRNLEKFGNEVQPISIANRIESGNRHFSIKDDIMQKKFYRMLREKQNFKDIGEGDNGLYFQLSDVYVDREYMYFKILLNNTSSISYDLDLITFERAQGKTIRRKEAISNGYLDVQHYESVYSIAPGSEEVIIYAVKIFALQDNDFILVKLNEMEGVRSLQFNIPAKKITNAKTL